MGSWTDGVRGDGWRVEFEPQGGPRLAVTESQLKHPSLPQALCSWTSTACPSPPRQPRSAPWTSWKTLSTQSGSCLSLNRRQWRAGGPVWRMRVRRRSWRWVSPFWPLTPPWKSQAQACSSPYLLPSLSVFQDLSLSLATFQPSPPWGLYPSEACLNQRGLNLCGSFLVYTLLCGLHSDRVLGPPLVRLLEEDRHHAAPI